MTEILAVFRSRAQAIDCNSVLRANGIPASLINTPKEANVGCGLSVKLPQNNLVLAKRIIFSRKYSAFYGFLSIQNRYGRTYFTGI